MNHALPGPVGPIAIVLCSAAAIVAAVDARSGATTASRYSGRATELAHVVMLVAMAAMWTPIGGDLPATVWRAVFSVLAIAMSAWVVAAIGRRTDDAGAAIYHCVAAFAMLYATLGEQHHHHAGPASQVPVPLLGWVFVAIFALDAVITLGALAWQIAQRRPARALFPHLVMDAATAVMIWQALSA
ncbi:DUF5134 domain-containing protein [Nocardia fluminea]|uniref:Uncharacterized protein DUF5134 n=1 Tax=Nocardia fluminea TaxID=134984 RepID=A0A2N3VIN5_9NOCA|nr:DUF5134 domain-containing protein [Nocardia fluminea]PKV81473.1 uncharacterized protein DUF5134 [Nocardia fluminea]